MKGAESVISTVLEPAAFVPEATTVLAAMRESCVSKESAEELAAGRRTEPELACMGDAMSIIPVSGVAASLRVTVKTLWSLKGDDLSTIAAPETVARKLCRGKPRLSCCPPRSGLKVDRFDSGP